MVRIPIWIPITGGAFGIIERFLLKVSSGSRLGLRSPDSGLMLVKMHL